MFATGPPVSDEGYTMVPVRLKNGAMGAVQLESWARFRWL